MTAPAPERPRLRRVAGWVRWLPALTLTAVLTITASTEFALARTVLALPPAVAWALPVAIDSYVLAALRSGRDVLPAMAVMAGALAAATGAHLAGAGLAAGRPLPTHVVAPAATAIMTVLVIVAWRVHVLIEHPDDERPPSVVATVVEARRPVLAPPPSTPAIHAASTPVRAPSTPPAPVAVPDTPADGESVSTPPRAVPSTADGRRALTRPAAATTPSNRPTSSATALTNQTDDQIIAAITGEPPSIRTLMRTHGIGQNRATRIHQAARRRHEQDNENHHIRIELSNPTKINQRETQHQDPEPSAQSQERQPMNHTHASPTE